MGKKLRVLDICSIPDEAYWSIWNGKLDENRFEIIRAGVKAPEEKICELIKDVDILLTDSLHFTPVTRKIIQAGTKLRLIQCYTIGFDDVDLETAKERGIPVANSAGITAKPMAEYTVMASLYLIKSVEYANKETNNGNWAQQQLMVPPLIPLELGSLIFGIVGCGAIGQEIARMVKVFGTRIIYNNRKRLSAETEQKLGVEYATLDELLQSSDIVSINVPLTGETRDLIGRDKIAMMKKGSVLVNTSRGGVVNEVALAEALKIGHLRGAALDVYEDEKNVGSCPLIGLKNVILTPHSSALSPDLMKRVPVMVSENLNRFYEGKTLLRLVI